jgi:hypothetical protein
LRYDRDVDWSRGSARRSAVDPDYNPADTAMTEIRCRV